MPQTKATLALVCACAFAYELVNDRDPGIAFIASKDLRRWFVDSFTNLRAEGYHVVEVGLVRGTESATSPPSQGTKAIKWQMDRTGAPHDLKGPGINVHLLPPVTTIN